MYKTASTSVLLNRLKQGCSWCAGYVGAVGGSWKVHPGDPRWLKVTTSTPKKTSRSMHSENRIFFGGVSKWRKPKTKRFGEDTNFPKLLIQPKRFTPLISPLRLGEKTGMGRALGMPRRICGMDWLWRAAYQPRRRRGYMPLPPPMWWQRCHEKEHVVGGQWPKVDMRSKKTWLIDDWVLKGEWNSVFETRFLT